METNKFYIFKEDFIMENNNVVIEETNQEKLYYPAEEVVSESKGNKLRNGIIIGAVIGTTIIAGSAIIKKIKAKRLKKLNKESEKVETEDYAEVETEEDSDETKE